MQTRAGTFAEGVEAFDARLTVEINLDTTTHIVGSRAHRDIVGGDVDADGETLLVDVREVMAGLLGILMGDVETDMIQTVDLHLLINGTCHDVTRCQRQTLIVFLHKLLTVGQFEDTAVAAHRLGDEVGGMGLFRIMEYRGMELHELHVGYRSLGTIHHGDAVASGNHGI